MVQSLIRGLAKWHSTDLAELLVAIKTILDARAEHQRERDKRSKGKRVGGRSEK